MDREIKVAIPSPLFCPIGDLIKVAAGMDDVHAWGGAGGVVGPLPDDKAERTLVSELYVEERRGKAHLMSAEHMRL